MDPIKKFWYDENSEPPKNYIWVKNDKQYEFNVSERKWKEINSSEESGSSSKEVTIDDVVKFIHDDSLALTHDESNFPYTTYDEIPEYDGHSYVKGIYRMTLETFESAAGDIFRYLYTPSGIVANVMNAPAPGGIL